MNSSLTTDVLIVGSGIAGLFAAYKISQYADVIIVTKKDRTESNTNYAQGGIASVFSKDDSFEQHISDTLIAGAGLCNEEMVQLMVTEGPYRINDLVEIGTNFSYRDNKLDLILEGGHSKPRIIHSKDLTGKEIESALITLVNSIKNIRIIENTLAIELLTEHNVPNLKSISSNEHTCWGAYVLNTVDGFVYKIRSRVTILATGGVGQVYQHTTNPSIATGDGIALSFRAGAKIANMEFIQFHPTSLYTGFADSTAKRSFLISEALRGFGAILRTRDGIRFMENYDDRKELAPRDIVARAIDSELKRSGDEFVLLDITSKNPEEIKSHFPNIFDHCLKYDIDITCDPIPIVPAAHYACGGVMVDSYSKTTIKNLYACGEVAMTGVHGANRLASNSLLEAIVFAERAANDIKIFLKNESLVLPDIPEWDDSGTLSADEKVLITHNLKEVKTIMWDYVSIVRSNQRLERAAKRIKMISDEVEDFYRRTKIFSELLELRNLLACAHLIIYSALQRKESRGLHYTLDYPELSDIAENTIIQHSNF